MNSKYILSIVILVVIIAGGFFAWQYFGAQKEEVKTPKSESEVEVSESKPYIRITSPTGGETWRVGNTYDITWESNGVEKVYIFLGRRDASDVTELITENYPASLGKYSWTIPSDNPDINVGGEFEIVIASEENNEIRDRSNYYFRIIK